MSEPRVPLHVEPLDTLRARYPAAVAELLNSEDIQNSEIPAPSSLPHHVFDTPDGWRLIVSRELLPNSLIVVHLSASIHDETLLAQLEGEKTERPLEEICRLWRYLARSDRTPDLVYVSPKGVPHFFVEQIM